MMFLLISFALANNYCIEKTKGRCETICQNLPEKIDDTFSYIPDDYSLNTDNNEKHNIYIADQVDYQNSSHNFIFCDPSIQLIYKYPIDNIKLKDHIYINSSIMLKDAPILFQFYNNLKIEIYSNEKNNFGSITLESCQYNNIVVPIFFSDNFPENLILISSNSQLMKLFNNTEQIKKVFNTTEKFSFNSNFRYYCISDKEKTSERCSDYSYYSLNHINSISEIYNYNYIEYLFVIIDTSLPQILTANANSPYYHYHVIGLENSDLTFYPNYQHRNGDFYTIINTDSIEMPNLYFEGKGKLTLATSANISFLVKTTTNNNHFTLKAKHPFVLNESCIHSINENSNINLVNKIKIADYCAFVVPKNLAGLFEQGKYFLEENFNYDVTVNSLKEFQYDYVTYYFRKGDHDIPSYWKRPCRFQGIVPEETNFIFDDVHYYDGKTIDNFIDVNYKPSKSFNRITIKPSSYFYLDSFGTIYNPESNEQYTIQVDNDFVMYGPSHSNGYDDDEFSKEQCKIVGHGTIKFIDSSYMKKIKNLCTYDEKNINFEYVSSQIPYFYACIGQESFDKCKSEINDIDSIQNFDWIWVRNVKTLQKLKSNNPVYITDDQIFYEYYYYNDYGHCCDFILTSNANLLIPHYSQLTLYNNGIDNIKAQSPTAKLTIFYNGSDFNYVYHFDYINYNKQPLRIYYNEAPTSIDLQVYFHFENSKLYMKYLKNYEEKSIKLAGKTVLYYREPYIPQMAMFSISDNIKLVLNPDSYYNQICYSDNPVESENLYDFVFANNIQRFNELKSINADAYVYKDITLSLNSSDSFSRYFYFINDISVTIDLPNATYFLITSYNYKLVFDEYDYHYLYFDSNLQKFAFDIKDYIYLDYDSIAEDPPNIKFTSSKNSVEIFPNPSLKDLNSLDYTISVPNGFTIYSPAPNYLNKIFDSASIQYSSKWSYLYLSDIEKEIKEPFKLITHQNFENDENLPENIVLMIDQNDKLTIPANWENIHNIYYQGEDPFIIENPTNIRYQIDGIVLNSLIKIVAGDLNIIVPASFTVNTDRLYMNCYISKYMYDAILNCSLNSHTDLYINETGYSYSVDVIKIYGNNEERSLYINANNENDLSYFRALLDLYSDINVKYILDYHFICYNSDYYNSVCSGKYFQATGIESLLNAIKDYPGLPIIVAQDLTIPYSTGDHFVLHPINENIQINIPYSPGIMTITDQEYIKFEYTDSTIIEITNKSKIDVNLNGPLEFRVESDINSLMSFNLGSDVLISTQKNINANLNIQLNENSYNLYSETIDRFGPNFKGKIHQYYKICAYDKDAESFCTFSDKNTIENIFNDNFKYNEVELALSSQERQMILPSIKKQAVVNILPSSKSILTIQKVTSLEIEPNLIIINDYWRFKGDLSRLYIELDSESALSITGTITIPITLKLTSINSVIDLYDCDKQSIQLIKIIKYRNEQNFIKILGTDEIFNNLLNILIEYNDISFTLDNRQKYLCICNDDNSYNKCQGKINGIFRKEDSIKKDPGRAVKIRIFSNIEIPMNIFKKEHDVFLDYEYHVNLSNIKSGYQNIDEGIKIEKLTFVNGTNLLLKPRENKLNIWMKEYEPGPYFTIDVDQYLGLLVPNIENEHSSASRIHVTGNGELNVLDYPIERIRPGNKIKLIKGIYIICGTRNGNSICSYESDYKKLNDYNSFENDFDTYSKIIVFLNSFSGSMDVRMNRLSNQKIQFIRTSYSKSLLDNQNPIKLRFLSTSELIEKSDSEIGLSNSFGGVSLNSSDSDLFVVGFDNLLTIKQEDPISKNLNGIVIQPFNNKATINIDESVDLSNQKLKIETENNKPVSLTIVSNNKNIDKNQINKLFDYDPNNVAIKEVIITDEINPTPLTKTKKNKFTTKGIIAIVVVSAILVVVAVVGVIFAVRTKKKNKVVNSCEDVSE